MVNMGNVWDRTTEFLGDHLRALWPVILGVLLVANTISALMSGASPPLHSAVAQTITLLCALAAIWGQLVVIALALDPVGGRPRATATGRFGRAVAAMLILLAVIIVLALPVVGVMAANGVDLTTLGTGGTARANLTGGTAVFVSLYSAVLGAIVLLVAVRLTLLYPVVVAEGGVIAAIKRAWALSRGIVWKMIGVLLLFVIVYFVATQAVTSGVGTVLGFFADMRDPFSIGRILVAILSGAVTTAFNLIMAAFSAMLYRAVIAARGGVATA